MAKGQLRGNRETKKPKQDKKAPTPGSTFGSIVPKSGSQTADTKKGK